jgi:L-threonylcarbamoyladenylate synthase
VTLRTILRPGLDPDALDEACALLARGELVAFATETVYGLGADARRADAAARIYAAKGRPSANPLIVHVRDADDARRWCSGWDERADRLAARFWPGPLTLVLGRGHDIPAVVAGGGDTLALRAPSHPVAQALLLRFGGPIAAPSANRSLHVSPTTAAHVADDLGGRVALVLDGGPSPIGLESTVLALTGPRARLLRPGRVRVDAIEAELGPIEVVEAHASAHAAALAAPGQLARHYAPDRPARLVEADAIAQAPSDVLVLTWSAPDGPGRLRLPAESEGFEAALYARLREAETLGPRAIWIERPPEGPAWTAVRDRLRRATTVQGPDDA